MQGSRTLTMAIERNLHSNCSTQIPVMNHSWRVRYFVAYAPFPILCKFSPFFSLFCMFVIKIPTDNAEQTKSMIIKDLCFCGYWVCSLHAINLFIRNLKGPKSPIHEFVYFWLARKVVLNYFFTWPKENVICSTQTTHDSSRIYQITYLTKGGKS